MNFLLSQDHVQIRDLLRDFFQERFGGEKIRKYLLESRNEQSKVSLKLNWDQFCELGALGGGVSESFGGLGLGFLNHIILVSEAGRTLAPLPILETLCFGILPAESVLKESSNGSQTLNKFLEDLISGNIVASGFIEKNLISETGDLLFFENQDQLKCLPLAGKSLEVKSSGAELLRGYREFDKIENEQVLGKVTNLRELELSRLVLVAAELIAVARAAEDLTLDFVKTRKQFGTSISTFQAIQHKMADIRVKLDSAESLLHFSGWAKDNSKNQFEESALSCFLHAQQISKFVVEECLQLHGGMGFTWESNIHLYLRRVLSSSLWFGDINKLAVELVELENQSSVGYQ